MIEELEHDGKTWTVVYLDDAFRPVDKAVATMAKCIAEDMVEIVALPRGVQDWDPDQPRDERGRWTSEGGGEAQGGDVVREDGPGDQVVRYGAVGNIPRDQAEVLANHEDYLHRFNAYGHKLETGVLVDKFGKTIINKQGDRPNVIRFTPDEIQQIMGAQGAIFSHNHPGGGSLSPEDIKFAAFHGLYAVRAIGSAGGSAGKGYNYTLMPEGAWPSRGDIEDLLWEARSEAASIFHEQNPLVLKGELSPQDATLEHWHRVWTELAPKYGLFYSREERNA